MNAKESLDFITQCSKIIDGKPCKNTAIYTLNTHNGEIRVCKECDESYTTCIKCGEAVLDSEACFLNSEDEGKTCFHCI